MAIHEEWQSTEGLVTVRVTLVYGDTLTRGGIAVGIHGWLDGPGTVRVTSVYGDTLTWGGGV